MDLARVVMSALLGDLKDYMRDGLSRRNIFAASRTQRGLDGT